MRCRECRSPILRRSRTRVWERPLRFLSLRPYRCRECGHRSYISTWRHEPAVREQSHSFPVGQRQPDAGAVKIAAGKKWMLVYGLLGCLFAIAIASLKFGPAPFASKNPAPDKSSIREATDVTVLPREAATQPNATSRSPSPKTIRQTAARAPLAEPVPISRPATETGSFPAEAIRAERPKVPPEIQSAITSDNLIKVRVWIDASGKVTDATVVSATGPVATSLEGYSLDTARRWRFRPARNNNKAIRSDRVLEFLFRPSNS
jgi:TonB family protein